MSKPQTADTFWARVVKSDGCWEWSGACNGTGYGIVVWHGKTYTAHRVAAWLAGVVDSPSRPARAIDATHVLHTCDNRRCCNPAHFFLGTYSDNMRDAYAKRRKSQPKGQEHVNAKLTNAQAAAIRAAYGNGCTQQELAREYGVSQRTISLIVRKETYK